MAEKHIHTVNLRAVRNVAPRRRAGKAMHLLKEYVDRHTGADSISVSPTVNERLWADGARNPPKTIEVQVAVDDGTAHVELVEHDLEVPSADGEAAADEGAAELTDEELADLNVDEVKERVEAGDVDPQRALDVEYAGKNRKTLIEWLQGRVGDDADEAEEAVEPDEEQVDEEPDEEEPADEEDEDAGRETYDLPDDVVETFEDGTIDEGKDAAKELGKDAFEKLLNFEEAHQDRKGMKKFLRSNMN